MEQWPNPLGPSCLITALTSRMAVALGRGKIPCLRLVVLRPLLFVETVWKKRPLCAFGDCTNCTNDVELADMPDYSEKQSGMSLVMIGRRELWLTKPLQRRNVPGGFCKRVSPRDGRACFFWRQQWLVVSLVCVL